MGSKNSYPSQINAVEIFNAAGHNAAVLVCEHASNYIPAELNNLGLEEDLLESHIAWDPGALAVARLLVEDLEAPLVASRVSRLVYDCNRPPEAKDASPSKSEVFDIPGNCDLTEEDRSWREKNVYNPFKNALSQVIENKMTSGQKPVIFTIHSFTPVYKGNKREVEIGIIHDRDHSVADLIMAEESEFVVRRNEPYAPTDGVAHTLRLHGDENGLANVMIEIRNDLIKDSAGVAKVAAYLSDVFKKVLEKQKTEQGL
ncbi:N-formylglutamate amidohydrolase [Curvivirga sp.]|uniref:N-formylglutamate amidohydrolase n=1 Tax=Curvivirga sp. TaxID=2856848 RepID=UPI003B5AA476